MVDLIDIGVKWFTDIVEEVATTFRSGLEEGYRELGGLLFGTPVPGSSADDIFAPPSGGLWGVLYDTLIGGEIMQYSLLLLVITFFLHQLVRIVDVTGAYRARVAQRSIWTGGLLVVTWYWLAALACYLVNGLTVALLPSLSTVGQTLFDFTQVVVTNWMLALGLAVIGGVAMWALEALLIIRYVLLYVYLLGMPLLLAVGFSNVPVLSALARGLARRFVPLLVLPLPLALLFKAFDLFVQAEAFGDLLFVSAYVQTLVAVALPVLGLLVTWRLFKDAAPLTATVIGTTTAGVATVGAVVGLAAVAGPGAAATAGRFGARAGVGYAAGNRLGDRFRADPPVTDANGQQGVPAYRRAENDPGVQ
jgi:type IV secretion system protein TrbL